MRIWDSIRRLSGSTFRKQNTRLSSLGILKNKKAQKRQLQIEQFEDRILLSINSPELNAIFVNQDESQYFDPASTNQVYHIAPESFLLRFNEGQELDPTSLASGIQIVRAGADGKFDTADDVLVGIGWVGLNGSRGDGKDVVSGTLAEGIVGNEVIIRFAEALPDDLYQIRLIGSGDSPLKNLDGDVFHDGDNLSVAFELDLGAQIVATVPQPTFRGTEITFLSGAELKDGDKIVLSNGRTSYTFEFDNNSQSATGNVRVTFTAAMTATQIRAAFLTAATPYLTTLAMTSSTSGTNVLQVNGYGSSVSFPAGSTEFPLAEGTLGQARDKVVLYFNANDPLYFPGFSLSATNAMSRSYTTTDAAYMKLFQLIATQNTADSADDIVHTPTRIEYTPATGEMILTFANELDKLNGFDAEMSAARLRVGTLYEKTATDIIDLNNTDPGDAFHTSFSLAAHFDTTTTISGPQSLVIHGQINPKYDPIEYTGARDEPGHRDLPIGYGLGGENHINGDSLNGSADRVNGPTIFYYNFQTILGYDANNNPYNNEITEAQKNLARQIFQMYSRYLGIEFIEDSDTDSPRGITVATGDLRVLGSGYTSEPGGVAGLGAYGTIALMDKAEDWGTDVYGGGWFNVAIHEIGHTIGLGHTYDLPNGTTMGSTTLIDGQVSESTYPGDYDILHGQFIYRPDSTDIDLYKFVVETGQRGMFSAEIYAQRENAASLLDATLTLYRQVAAGDGSIYYEMVARNDDYFGKDSFLEMYLSEGIYFIGVASSGNDQYNPELEGTGEGGTTSGNYELRLTFTPGGVDANDSTTYKEEQSKTTLVDATGVKFDGDHDGTPGGEYNFWFNVQSQDKTIYVDKVAGPNGDGSIGSPYNTIKDALSNAKEGDIIRIVGNNYDNDDVNLTDNLAYEIGTDKNTNTTLSDGATFDVPRGVTIVIDAGAVLKFAGTNINVGSFAENIDRSGGSIQVLGTPGNNVIFTSYYDQTIGTKTSALDTTGTSGDWGGISIRNDLDYEFIETYDPSSNKTQREVLEEQGIFLNYINHADFRFGGGTAAGASGYYTPISLNSSQATVSYNTISNSQNAAISADLSSFEETRFQSWDHNPSRIYTLDYTRIGPAIYGNTVVNNAVNGLAIRAKATTASSSPQMVTGHIRFDDTDIVHVMQENIIIQGTTGEYATTPVTAPALSVEYLQYSGSSHSTASNTRNDQVFDSNLVFNNSGRIPADGEYFSLSDGTITLVFEFNHIDTFNSGGGVKQGRVQVDINSTDSVITVRNKLAAVINSFSATDYLDNYRRYIPNGGNQIVKPFKITAQASYSYGYHIVTLSGTGTELEVGGTGLVKANTAGRLMVDPGIIIKAGNARIEAQMGAQVIAEGNAAHQIVITSLYDTRYGAGGSYTTSTNRTNPTYLPQEGDWSGIFFNSNSKGSLDHVVIAFAGGVSAGEGGNIGFNPVEIHQADVRIANGRFEYNTGVVRGDFSSSSGQVGRGSATPAVIFVRGAQPVIIGNEFFSNTNGMTNTANALALISVNANAMTDESVIDWGRSTGPVSSYTEYNDNYGPLVRDNSFTGNSVNGMVVRGEIMTVSGIWDDADIAHVLYTEIKVANYHSGTGLRLMSAPGQSLVIKLLGSAASFTTLGTGNENADRIGGAIQIIGVAKYPVVLTSLKDDSVGAGYNLKGQVMFDTNNDGSASAAAPGDWRNVRFDSYSNDRNVLVISELEKSANESEDQNGTTALAQYLGRIASEDKNGDDVYHLGYEIYGSIRSDAANEADVYSFTAEPGTEIWIDIDNTSRDLDLIIEVIDGDGNVLARSDNSYMEEYGYGEVETFEGALAFTMNKDRWNRMDFYSINQRDPGLRFVTPGSTGGEEKTYFIRVRSALGIADVSNVSQATSDGKTFVISDSTRSYSFVFDYNRDATDAAYLAGTLVNGSFIVPMKDVANTETAKQQAIVDAVNKANDIYLQYNKNDRYGQAIATARIAYVIDGNGALLSYIVLDGVELDFNAKDTGLTSLANSSGNYTMQLRLQESDEVPGCSVMYADIRYAVNGVEAYGFPQNSPIQGEFYDVAGNSFATAADLGNLLGSNSGTISVSGYMSSLSQVDWYRFSLNYRDVQFIAGNSNAGNIWSAVFDIDYADGLTRPDLTLWVFDSGGRLIYIGTDSNVADDQYDPSLSTSIEKLSAGSAGAYDPFIGPANLVAGIDGANSNTYYVAVTSATTFASVMNEAQTRLEPIDSLQRIVEERVDQGQDMDNGRNSAELEAAQRLTLTPDEYSLSDVVTYLGTSGGIYMIDPYTGSQILSRNNASNRFGGIQLRDNGLLYTFTKTGNNAPQFTAIDQGQVSNSTSSVSTNIIGYGYNNGYYTTGGFVPNAFATSQYDSTRYTGLGGQLGYTLVVGSLAGAGSVGSAGYDQNVMYLLGPDGRAITRTSSGNPAYASEEGRVIASCAPIVQFSTLNGLESNSEVIQTMTQGNDGNFYLATNYGNVYLLQGDYRSHCWTEVNLPSDAPEPRRLIAENSTNVSLKKIGVIQDENGSALSVTGISAGPKTVEDGLYRDLLFVVTGNGQMRAFVPDTSGPATSQPILFEAVFFGGTEVVSVPVGGSVTFSTVDYNLWHRVNEDDNVHTSPSLVRSDSDGYDDSYYSGASWYYGLTDSRTSYPIDAQPYSYTFRNDYGTGNDIYNTYDVPGGTYGSLTSNSFSLEGYAPADKPALYFTYKTGTDSTGSFSDSADLPAVYLSADGGEWVALAVGNGYSTDTNSYWDRTNEAQYNAEGYTYQDYYNHYIDILVNDNQWRQAKVDLSQFAGAKDIRLKFVFSTAGGDIGLGIDDYDVAGTLITAPAADQILDNGWRVGDTSWVQGWVQTPGDGSLTIDNSQFVITSDAGVRKTFRFVNGYSVYVPSTPNAYGSSVTLTINNIPITVPIESHYSAEQMINAIIMTINNAREFRDAQGNQTVVAKRYLDVYGNASGQMISIENAETFTTSLNAFTVIGGPQETTLEDIAAMTVDELSRWVAQDVIPVPFRADMTQSQIAGTVSFITNLVFNGGLAQELAEVPATREAIPVVEALQARLRANFQLGCPDNAISIINDTLRELVALDADKAIPTITTLLRELNVSVTNVTAETLQEVLNELNREAAAAALPTLRTLQGTFNGANNPGTTIVAAFQTAITSLSGNTPENSVTVLNTLINALNATDAIRNATVDARAELDTLRTEATQLATLHNVNGIAAEIARLNAYTENSWRTGDNYIVQFDTFMRNLVTSDRVRNDASLVDLPERLLQMVGANSTINRVSALLNDLDFSIKESAVDVIERVTWIEYTESPYELIDVFSGMNMLERVMRVDTSSIANNTYTEGLKSTTNSVQMSLVNRFAVPDNGDGPLVVQRTELDGTQNGRLTGGSSTSAIPRSQNNANGGFYIDNIIVGFASRGEMVTNASSNTGFNYTTADTSYVKTGSYQLEIRRGTEYSSYSASPTTGLADATLWTVFNINERQTEGVSFFAPDASQVSHNQKFSISDGVKTLTFVFINTKFGGGAGDDIKIEFTDGDSAIFIANRIKDAINLAYKNGLFKVTATTGNQSGDSTKSHSLVDLFNATDFRNLTDDAMAIKHVIYGASTAKQTNDGTITGDNGNEIVMQSTSLDTFLGDTYATRLYIDPTLLTRIGDENTVREKGQLTLYGNSITHSSNYAIVIAPGDNQTAIARQQSDYRSSSNLIPGIAVTNNVLAFNNAGGISITGQADAIPFVRILNNTIYGASVAVGTGISLGSNTAATVMNNILANLNTGIVLNGANSNEMVYRSNTYKGNSNNGAGTGSSNAAQLLSANDPLFVNEGRGNFYLAANSLAIDSATETLEERIQWYNATLLNLGISESAIISPETDMYGQLRGYDENTSGSGTGGSNPGLDRGAIERVDFDKPSAALGIPHDVTSGAQVGNTGDQDANRNDIFLIAEYYSRFTIQLSDTGIGIDDLSVAGTDGSVYEHIITIIEETWDGTQWVARTLVLNSDYFANYNTANDLITLTPNRGQWSSDARYRIVLNNGADGICDLAGNTLMANRSDGTVTFNIVTTGYDYGDAPDPKYPTLLPSDGPRHVVYHGYHLGDRVSVDYSPNASTNADGDNYDDGVKLEITDLVTGKENTFLVKISDINEAIKDARGDSTTIGWLNFWVDWDDSGEFSSTTLPNGYAEHYQFEITQDTLDDADEDGYIRISVNAPRYAADGVTELSDSYVFARFRFSSEQNLTANGAAPDGEVEDYRFHMVKNLKTFGDAPQNYTPDGVLDGWHAVDLLWGYDINNPTKPMLGKESELVAGSGQQLHFGDIAPTSKTRPNYSDKADGNGDEDDGADFAGMWFVAGEQISFKVKVNLPDALKDAMQLDASLKVYLNGWFDVNCDGTWSDTEHILDNHGFGLADIDADGYVTVTVTVPDDAQRGETFARLRISTSRIDSPHGPELASGDVYDGEIEDHVFNALDKRRDFGDAPGNENTMYDDGGAAHVIIRDANNVPQLAIGTKIDEEIDGRPASDFEDYKSNVPSDNDGLADWRLVIGEKSFLVLTLTNTTTEDAYLNVWVDLNNNGIFDDASEQLVTDFVVPAGTAAGTQFQIELTNGIPSELVHVEDDPDTEDVDESVKETVAIGEKFMRMRLSHQSGIGPRGSRIEIGGVLTDIDGEVEDYVIVVQKATAGITGNVYQDLNADGIRQDGETAGLEGLIVYIDVNGDGMFGLDQFGELEPYAVADENGYYELNGVWNSIYDETYKVRVLKDVSDLASNTGLEQTVIDAYKDLLAHYDEYIQSSSTFQYEVAIGNSDTVTGRSFGFFAKPHLSINDVTIVEGDTDADDAAVRTEVEMDITMANKYGTNVMADVWVAYDTILTTLGLRLTAAGLKYQILVADASTGDFVEVSHAADAFTTDAEGVVTVNEGWVKLLGGEYAEYTGKIKLVILGDVDVERDEAFNVTLNADGYVELLKDLTVEDGTSVASIIIEKGTGQVVIINNDGAMSTGSAPDTYGPTLIEDAGARHLQNSGMKLGNSDSVSDGVTGYNGVKSVGYVTMDQFLFVAGEANKLQASVTNTTGKTAYLIAWMDVNGDGVWDPATEQVIGTNGKGIAVQPGVNDLTITLPIDAYLGETFIRFRLSSDENLPLGGMALDGEVEDYEVFVVSERLDRGSAPGTYGDPTHGLPTNANGDYVGPYLGNTVRPEYLPDYRNIAGARDDDGVAIADKRLDTGITYVNALYAGRYERDEDGELVLDRSGNPVLRDYGVTTITINASQAGRISLWVDLNGNGVFDADERVELRMSGSQTSDVYLDLKAGTNSVDVLLPESGLVDTFYTFARFRFTDQSVNHATLTPTNYAPNGEVEDYLVSLLTQNSTISGTVYHDMNADGKYGVIDLPVPEIDVLLNKGAVLPYTTGSSGNLNYNSYYYMPGISSSPIRLSYGMGGMNDGMQIEIGGKTYDSFIVTDKGAVMLINYAEYIAGTGTSIGVPSVYSGDNPTFAPFLSNMVEANVRYATGTDANGDDYLVVMWNNDFGVLITDQPGEMGEEGPIGNGNGDLVTYFYSDAFIESLRQSQDGFHPVQIGTNFGGEYYALTDVQTYYSLAAVVNYLDSLDRTSILNPDYVAPEEPVEGEEPGEELPEEPQYLPGGFKHSTYRLNPMQGDYVYQPVLTGMQAQLPEDVVIPESYYMPGIDTGSYYTVSESTAVQSFGFIFEFGGQRYSSYRVTSDGRIALINAEGYSDAYINVGMPYVTSLPTIDKLEGVSANGNQYVQIRWNSSFGVIIENDPNGDLISLFYAADSYTKGVLLGGENENSYVYTDPSTYTIGFYYSNGDPAFNVVQSVTGGYGISSRNDFDTFYRESGGQLTYRLSATTGKLYHYEPGTQGVKVYIDENGNGRWDEGERWTRSDANGHYEFTELYPGNYVIREDIVSDPAAGTVSGANGWIQTGPPAMSYPVSVTELGDVADRDFGNYKKGIVTITDTKVIEGTGSNIYAEIEVELRDAFGALITFEYVTEDGTAKDGTDYLAGSGVATINPQLAPSGQWTVKTALTSSTTGQYDRSISGDFIAYEEYDRASDQWKVYIYDAVKGETFKLTDNIGHASNDRMPSIVQDGDMLRLVWSSYDPNLKSYQIFYSEAPVNDLSQLTDNAPFQQGDRIYPVSDILAATREGDNVSPQISVYQKDDGSSDAVITWFCTMKSGKKEVFCIDSVDAVKHGLYSNIKQVTDNTIEETQVTVDGKNIVWIQNGLILYYQVGTSASPVTIPAGVGASSSPTISGDYIAWQQTIDPNTTSARTKILYYRISTGEVFEIDYSSYDYSNSTLRNGKAPCLDGDWLVWQEPSSDAANAKHDVMAFNIQSKVFRNLSANNPQDDIAPQVVGNRVVWRSYISEVYGEHAEWQIRFVDLDIEGFIPLTLSESTTTDWEPQLTETMVVWQSTHNVNGVNKIMVATQEDAIVRSKFQIEIVANDIPENDKDFSVTLTGIRDNLADLGDQTTGIVTILNDDGGEHGFDYGDAPASYATLLEDDGPRHVIKYVNEGGVLVPIAMYKENSNSRIVPVDAETDGRPSANADGDDTFTSNDENGVEFVDSWVIGDRVCVKVYATTACSLNLWVDWNGNGRFGDMATGVADAGEHVTMYDSYGTQVGDVVFALQTGENEIWIDIPADAKLGKTYARFRVSTESDLKWFGSALDGEVEDHAVTIVARSDANTGKLVYVDGDTLVVKGTAMNDTISIVRNATGITVTHNGSAETFLSTQNAIRHIDVNTYAGNDVITITGLASEEQNVVLKPFEATVTSATIDIAVVNAERINYVGTSGIDKVQMYDSLGDDIAVLSPNSGSITNGVFTNSVQGVKQINAFSARGGDDHITLNGSDKIDYVTSWSDSVSIFDDASLELQTYYNRAFGFGQVTVNAVANAKAGEEDVATIYERTDAGIQLNARPDNVVFSREARERVNAVTIALAMFNSVQVSSLGGGSSRAVLYGSDGNDTLVATDTQLKLSGLRDDGTNYSVQVSNFGSHSVNAGGGNDHVSYTSTKNGNHLSALSDGQTLELYGSDNFDAALLELIAFESARFDAGSTKTTKDLRNYNQALIEIDLKGDWTDKFLD